MAYNKEIAKHTLDDITRDSFCDALGLAFRDGITSRAPLGYSGDTIILHGIAEGGRQSLVSVRNHSGSAELLITDCAGDFIFLGKYHKELGDEFIANQYWLIFRLVKDKIKTTV